MATRTSNRAVLYLRSSKDRSDVSIDAQRRELTDLAGQRALVVAGEYSDVVVSGSEEIRPGLSRLVEDMRARGRPWGTVLLLDTSRLARQPIIAVMFERDAERAGVRVVYKSIPDDDPISGMLLKNVFRGIDQWHSLTSKRKGLAGMAENVRQGWRAGGRAPRGYRLVSIGTGTVREGSEVEKTKLEPNDDAPVVSEYLRMRADGIGRGVLARQLKIPWPRTSLNGMEWNALTYAGHTVWNVHNEHGTGGYKGGAKRRPRDEWVIQRDTHPALISDAVAETLLAKLDAAGMPSRRDRGGAYLLTGLLRTPAGEAWKGGRTPKFEFYRASMGSKTRSIAAARVDATVIDTVARDLQSSSFVAAAVKATREKFALVHSEEIAEARQEIVALELRAGRFLEMASELQSAAPVLRKIDELERQRATIEQRILAWEKDDEAAQALANITDAQVRTMLGRMADEIRVYERAELRDFLGSILDRIELDPEAATLQVCYRIPLRGVLNVASPRGFEPRYSP
jgi:site-specific DNA recombinase